MKKPSIHINLLTHVFISATFYLLAAPSARSSEPSYNSKPLSEWLLILKIGYTSAGERVEGADAREAIQEMGTNAIPTLLSILGATERNKWWVLEKLKSPEFREQFRDRDRNIDDLTGVAVMGFGVLGTNAVSAIPGIAKLFKDWETCSPAAQALAELGPEGFAALTNGLSSKNADIRGVTIWAIGEKAHADSKIVTRIMVVALKDSDWNNRTSAVRYLGGKDPDVAIPILLPLLENRDYDFGIVGRSLSSYGSAADVAIPKLLSLYTNNWDVRVMWALKAIDMGAAAKAEEMLINSGPLNSARSGYTRTTLTNGLELIAGGYIHTEIPAINNRQISSTELLNPKTGKWTETGEMSAPRYDHTAVLQSDGKVLVTGGYGSHSMNEQRSALSTAELYDPAAGTWTVVTNK